VPWLKSRRQEPRIQYRWVSCCPSTHREPFDPGTCTAQIPTGPSPFVHRPPVTRACVRDEPPAAREVHGMVARIARTHIFPILQRKAERDRTNVRIIHVLRAFVADPPHRASNVGVQRGETWPRIAHVREEPLPTRRRLPGRSCEAHDLASYDLAPQL